MIFVGGAALPSRRFIQRSRPETGRTRLRGFVASAPGLAGDISLEPDILARWPVRDQDFSPTCIAFAVSACMELFWARRNGATAEWLSPGFLYWKMRSEFPILVDPPEGYAQGATRLSQARDVFDGRGVCLEPWARYRHAEFSDRGQGFETHWLYPEDPGELAAALAAAESDADGRKHPIAGFGYVHRPPPDTGSPGTPADETPFSTRFHRLLSSGIPVAIGLPVWPTASGGLKGNWETVEARKRGIVRAPCDPGHDIPAAAEPFTGHAVCLVGFREGRSPDDRGWFIFRNSLGLGFASNCEPAVSGVPAPGYGAVSADQIDAYCWEYLHPN